MVVARSLEFGWEDLSCARRDSRVVAEVGLAARYPRTFWRRVRTGSIQPRMSEIGSGVLRAGAPVEI